MYIHFMNFTKWRMKYIYYIIEYMILNLINPLNIVSILPYLILTFYQTILPSAERLSSKSKYKKVGILPIRVV